MTVAVPQGLDPLTLPLSGERLIEASAGTGKTWTISILYLRLLLGLGGSNAYGRQLSVKEILVLTFTDAATKELRGRIRDNIHGLRMACVRGMSDDPMYQALLADIPDNTKAISSLLLAERHMDEAAIYTIHGFCQKVLTDHAFESGSLFEQTLVTDELPLWRRACADFWRRHCYPLPLPVARAVHQQWNGPQALLRDILPLLDGELPVWVPVPDDDETLISRHHKIVGLIDNLKIQWRAVAGELGALITQSGVDKRSYSTRHLPNWLETITLWALQETQDYQLPKALERFCQSVLREKSSNGAAPEHRVFVAIDHLIEQPLTLRDLIIVRAVSDIRACIAQEKRQRAQRGFNDLLTELDTALQGENSLLPQMIRRHYPVLMIDEFQDTDPQQYRIFQTLYVGQPDCALLLIGDPKQAIYAFRGADVFTYIRVRTRINIQAQYTLDTNWRSSHAMVRGINRLFHQVNNPFLFAGIPFIDVSPARQNASLVFQLNGQTQPALSFCLPPGENIGIQEYQQTMAHQCAREIRNWLTAGQSGRAFLISDKETRAVQAADISILVRNRSEATLVRNALKSLLIPSVYLSNRDSVFETPEAKDLLWLLQAVLAPEQEQRLRRVMATRLSGLDARMLDALNHDEHAWDTLVEEFSALRSHWQQRGILPMLREFMARRALPENLLASPGGERRLTDIMHLGELLQEAATHLDGEPALVRWLARQIEQPDPQSASQQLRLESDRHLVQVISIHKSKGLEYPLVWLPFIANYREHQPKDCLYHDRDNFQAVLDLNHTQEASRLAQEERLAEDMRLFYVALTRAIYHCSMGIAPLARGKKSSLTDVHHSAIGWLVQRGIPGNARYLTEQLEALQDADIAVTSVLHEDGQVFVPETTPLLPLAARQFIGSIQDNWRITSYSGLQHHGPWRLQQDQWQDRPEVQGSLPPCPPTDEVLPSRHSFPRGAAMGIFLHHLLESSDVNVLMDTQWLAGQLLKQGLDQQWLTVMQQWLGSILHAPLNLTGVTLAGLSPKDRQAELQFHLPIKTRLTATELGGLIKKYDPLSARCPPLNFHQVQGMLKGFIDLVFRWQGKFYLLDYKSNWLGEDNSAYTFDGMAQIMIEHRYDVQYQLYTLALHRYLCHRLVGYDYQRHFGGVIYMFLRGVDKDYPGQGIFSCLPKRQLIEGLDHLFNGKKQPLSVQENAL